MISVETGQLRPPANMVVERFVPHAAVLPHANLGDRPDPSGRVRQRLPAAPEAGTVRTSTELMRPLALPRSIQNAENRALFRWRACGAPCSTDAERFPVHRGKGDTVDDNRLLRRAARWASLGLISALFSVVAVTTASAATPSGIQGTGHAVTPSGIQGSG